MCGYVRRHIGPKTLKEFLELLGLKGYYDNDEDDEPVMKHFYPAWGGDTRNVIEDLVIEENGALKAVEAIWWYDCYEQNGEVRTGEDRTLNARNLQNPYWQKAISTRRAIVIATGLGEGKKIEGKDVHFLVTADRLLLLGAVYQKFPCGKYSCAIITRKEHPRFTPYHDKAFPLFLPYNLKFLKLWLSAADDSHPHLAHLLSSPQIFADLMIKPVRTFKGEVPTGPIEFLKADKSMTL